MATNKFKNKSEAPDWDVGLDTPKHVAIIMDGNQRWARARGLPGVEGHAAGAKAVKRTLKACVKSGIQALTLFAFSSENWRRPEAEVSRLMQLFWESLKNEVDELADEQVQLNFFGDLSAFDPSLQEEMRAAMRKTAGNDRIKFNVAVNYGGRWDILQATRQVSKKVSSGELSAENITESLVQSHLCLSQSPNVDLCIRTSGEQRISNFLLWQIAYAELMFIPEYWPDFSDEILERVLGEYRARQRRFGRSSHQIEAMEKNMVEEDAYGGK